jgi:hypothetical protein
LLTEGICYYYIFAKLSKYVTMKIKNHEIFELHAEFCKVLSNPKRLMIIALLSKRDLSVGEISKATDTAWQIPLSWMLA